MIGEYLMKLCSKCKKRPAVVFMSDMANPNAEPNGLCLVCAKELGIKPINDMLKKMNISDEDIEQMSDQFMDIMSMSEDMDDSALNDETFDLGTAPAFPFMNKIFGNLTGNDSQNQPRKKAEIRAKRLIKNAAVFLNSIALILLPRQKMANSMQLSAEMMSYTEQFRFSQEEPKITLA